MIHALCDEVERGCNPAVAFVDEFNNFSATGDAPSRLPEIRTPLANNLADRIEINGDKAGRNRLTDIGDSPRF